MTQDSISDALKIAPPAAVAAAHQLMGFALADWVSILTIAWLIWLLAEKAYKTWRTAARERARRRRKDDWSFPYEEDDNE